MVLLLRGVGKPQTEPGAINLWLEFHRFLECSDGLVVLFLPFVVVTEIEVRNSIIGIYAQRIEKTLLCKPRLALRGMQMAETTGGQRKVWIDFKRSAKSASRFMMLLKKHEESRPVKMCPLLKAHCAPCESYC